MSPVTVTSLNDYQRQAMRFAVYKHTIPFERDRLLYLLMGAAGEAGEVLALHHVETLGMGEVALDRLAAELGDCLWYAAALGTEWRIPLETFSPGREGGGGNRFAAMTKLGACGGALAEAGKKWLRDGTAVIYRPQQESLVGNYWCAVRCVMDAYRLDVRAVAEANLAKLQSRADRDALQGSGDDR